MSGWLIFAGYVAGYLFTYTRVYPVAYNAVMYGTPSPEDRPMAAILALLSCTMWPLVILGYAVYRFATPVSPAERKHALDERERQIAKSERELGIGHDTP